jgi:hypothetical protein
MVTVVGVRLRVMLAFIYEEGKTTNPGAEFAAGEVFWIRTAEDDGPKGIFEIDRKSRKMKMESQKSCSATVTLFIFAVILP